MPFCRCLLVSSLFAHLALAASAQEAPKGFVMPLRADLVKADATKDAVLITGTIEWVDGRTTTDVRVSCARESLLLMKGNPPDISIVEWGIEPGFCNALARRVERRK
jgi:hypothetical protein